MAKGYRTVQLRLYDGQEHLLEPTGYEGEYVLSARALAELDYLRVAHKERTADLKAAGRLIRRQQQQQQQPVSFFDLAKELPSDDNW